MLQVDNAEMFHKIAKPRFASTSSRMKTFREANSLLGEITNVMWGRFKVQFNVQHGEKCDFSHQVPIIADHVNKQIDFGSVEPYLCFRYRISDPNNGGLELELSEKFIFHLFWDESKFSLKNEDGVDNTGNLELF